MAQSASSWDLHGSHYRSQSTEQLDKLLAGLDELSITLPDLSQEGKFPGEQQRSWNSSNTAGNSDTVSDSDNNSSAARPGLDGNMRSYEDDMDYALEKEMDITISECRAFLKDAEGQV